MRIVPMLRQLSLFILILLISCTDEDLNYDFREDYDWRSQRVLDTAEVRDLESKFEKVLKSGSNKFDSKFIQVAVRYHDARVIPFWRWLLRTDHPHLIATALRSLGRIRSDESVSLAEPYIDHPNPLVRQFAVNALGRLKQYATLEDQQKSEQDPVVLQVYEANLRKFTTNGRYADSPTTEDAFEFLPRFARSSFKKETFEYHPQVRKDSNPSDFSKAQSLPWAGQPVFSGVSGRVLLIDHNPDEGVIVEIQPANCDSMSVSVVTANSISGQENHRYTGLDCRILVGPDECVLNGQMLGEIGENYTLVGGVQAAH